MLTNDEWDLLRDLIFILGPFEEATGILEVVIILLTVL